MLTENHVSSPSSSSFFGSNRTDSNRTDSKNEEEEWLDAVIRRVGAQNIPCEFWPAPWCRRYRSMAALVDGLTEEPLAVPAPDAVDVIDTYGVPAVEGAMLKTLANIGPMGIRRPRGFFFSTLKLGKWYTPEAVHTYVSREWQAALRRMATSENPQYERWAEMLSIDSYRAEKQRPVNVTKISKRRAS